MAPNRVYWVKASESAEKYRVGTSALEATVSVNADLPVPDPAAISVSCPRRICTPAFSRAGNAVGRGSPALPANWRARTRVSNQPSSVHTPRGCAFLGKKKTGYPALANLAHSPCL
jgi:hypothetical protein